MPDMLVKLYELPPLEPALARLRESGVEIRRAMSPERHLVLAWVRERFSDGWESECATAFGRIPISCFVAVKERELVGFAVYDATFRGWFGPTGVAEAERGKGIGTGLLLACLHAMRWEGWQYAIIGGAGPTDYYARTVGATVIEGSSPGAYRGMLWKRREKGREE